MYLIVKFSKCVRRECTIYITTFLLKPMTKQRKRTLKIEYSTEALQKEWVGAILYGLLNRKGVSSVSLGALHKSSA